MAETDGPGGPLVAGDHLFRDKYILHFSLVRILAPDTLLATVVVLLGVLLGTSCTKYLDMYLSSPLCSGDINPATFDASADPGVLVDPGVLMDPGELVDPGLIVNPDVVVDPGIRVNPGVLVDPGV